MSFSEDILQQIEDYLNDSMTAEQIAVFENQINENSDLAEALDFNKKMRLQYDDDNWDFIKDNKNDKDINELESLLKSNAFQNKKKAIQSAGNVYFENEKPKNNNGGRFKFYCLAAASIALLICLSIFLNQDQNNQQLVNDYLDISSLPSFVSRGESSTNDLIEAQQFFENEDYQKSLEIFVPVIEIDNANGSVYLYTGIAQMKLEQYIKAETTFNKLINSDLLDAQKGHWYKALLYLKQDKVEDSKTVLEFIISNSYYNHLKAKALLETLNND